ncbi:hypothetical protein FJTKL_12634 [Diaporthe vaccinii]|uniref:AT hook domain-containing protein n=1 Tax=Diaporthe vaccinii TaxID=105482 RepID=A0ABR4ED67_9PEZI
MPFGHKNIPRLSLSSQPHRREYCSSLSSLPLSKKSPEQLTTCLEAIDNERAAARSPSNSSLPLFPFLPPFQHPPTVNIDTNKSTMAPTKTAAKGRARASRASDAAAVESPPPAAAADDTPRRRGRPAKSESGVSKAKVKKAAYVPTGRPRGRPANPNTVPKAPYVPTGRPRGRPPGTGKKAAKVAAMKARGAAAAAAKKGATVARGGPKGRKSDAAKAKEDEELGEDVDMEGDSAEEQAGDDEEQLSDADGGE